MKRTCLFLVAVMAFCALFTATAMCNAGPLGIFRNDSASSNALETWNNGQAGKVYQDVEVNAEIARPEDGDRNYLTVLGDADPAIVVELQASLPNAHFHHYKSDDPILSRYEKTVGTFPAVVYQQPNGIVIEKRSGANFPRSQRELNGFAEQCRPFRPKPEPTPPVQPLPPVAPPVIDPVPDTNGGDPSIWLYVLLFGGAGASAAGYQWYKEIKGE